MSDREKYFRKFNRMIMILFIVSNSVLIGLVLEYDDLAEEQREQIGELQNEKKAIMAGYHSVRENSFEEIRENRRLKSENEELRESLENKTGDSE